jgi:hypothetical protein
MEWQAEYVGPGTSDSPTAMVIDAYGNVYVTGSSNATSGASDYATVKYSTGGIQQWAARYPGIWPRGAAAYSVAVDRFCNVYVTGVAPVGSSGPSKYTTIKYNQSGVQCWVKIYYGEVYQPANIANSIATDYDANVYVTGYSYFNGTGYDYTTIKYDSSGVQQWIVHFAHLANDYAYRIAVDNSENVYVTGYIYGDTSFNNDIATIKYNSAGIQQWVATYNGPVNEGDSATAITVDSYGNVYVTGTSYGGPSTGYDYITIKYNSSGIQQWAARYNGNGNLTDIPHSIAVDSMGNVYVTGYTNSGTTHSWDFATVKYNILGVQKWVALYDYGSQDYATSIALDRQGYVYVTGGSWEGIHCHFATIKYSPTGTQEWCVRTSLGGESPVAIAVDSLNNVYVAGRGDGHYLTIKYNQLTGITPISNEVPGEYRLYQNYPNPFNPSTKIKFSIPLVPPEGGKYVSPSPSERVGVRLCIYDLLGREVTKLVNQPLQPGTYEVTWDGANYPSGVYFYKIEAGSFTDTKKLVLIK